MPTRIVALGRTPFRALVKVPGMNVPKRLGVSKRVIDLVQLTRGGVEIQTDGWRSCLHVSPFPLSSKQSSLVAAEILRDAARLSGVL